VTFVKTVQHTTPKMFKELFLYSGRTQIAFHLTAATVQNKIQNLPSDLM